jgi:O-antigen/teichoic acid export membrane protein
VITVSSIYSRLSRDIALNTLQVLVNQVLGVFIFLVLSRSLDKDIYGELNWSLAILTLVTTILSLRLEQIVVRNVAAGKDASAMLTLFTAHNLVTGTVFFLLLLSAHYLFADFFHRHYILWILSVSQLLSFFSLPFRQLSTGKSAFGWLALISMVSNIIRCGWIGWLATFSAITLSRVILAFTLSALAEFILGAYIVVHQLKTPFTRKENFAGYKELIKASIPQVGLVFLNAGIARIDWILMGLLSTPAHTAEYSFAYRAYEFSPLPLLVLAPLLLNSFSRHFKGAVAGVPLRPPAWLDLFFRLQLVFATLLPLWGVLLWSPVADFLTHHKYGQVNFLSFLILSCCIPFQYLVNIYWSAEFAANRLGLILKITAITAAIAVAGDLFLIPARAGEGAALAYLVAMVVQCFLYSRASLISSITKHWNLQMLLSMAIAAASGAGAILLTESITGRVAMATVFYGIVSWSTGRLDTLYAISGKMTGK